jgi:uncharacterized phage-associated protein
MDVTYDEAKFAEMVLYVAHALEADRSGGATKLNKVLFFADFAHVRRTGRPISGADYQKLPNGPAPRRLLPVRRELQASGAAELVTEHYLGYEQHRLHALRSADISVFSAQELATLDSVLGDLVDLTAAQVSQLSHEEAGWMVTEEGDTIDYATAYIAAEQVSTPTSRRLAAEVAERYGLDPAS